MDRRTKAVVIAAVALAVAAGAWVQYIDRDDGPDHPYLDITEEEKVAPPVDGFMESLKEHCSEFERAMDVPDLTYDEVSSLVSGIKNDIKTAKYHY